MQSVFEKIKERLEELIGQTYNKAVDGDMEAGIKNMAYQRAKGIVNQVAEEYNDGWIPCSKEMPKEKGMYLVSYGKNTQVIVESYNGVWFDEHYYCEQPKAWMHRPKPYDEEGE